MNDTSDKLEELIKEHKKLKEAYAELQSAFIKLVGLEPRCPVCALSGTHTDNCTVKKIIND